MSGHNGEDSARICAERRAPVEAEPPNPKKTGTDHREPEIVGCEIVTAIALAVADDEGSHKTRCAGIEMHDRATGEVENARLHGGRIRREPAAAPDPVCDRHIDDKQPECCKPHECRKAHA